MNKLFIQIYLEILIMIKLFYLIEQKFEVKKDKNLKKFNFYIRTIVVM